MNSPSTYRRTFTRNILASAILLTALGARPAAADPAGLSYKWTLGTPADLDPASPAHVDDPKRFGDAGTDGDTTYRELMPKVFQSTWHMPAFDIDTDLYGEINHPFFLTVHFKDIAKSPTKFMSYKGGAGFYGKAWIGTIGGAGDGQWKDQTLVIPESVMRSPDGKSFILGVRDIPQAIPIASMTLFSAAATDVQNKDKIIADAIKDQDERRAARTEVLMQKGKEMPLPRPNVPPPTQPEETAAGYRLFFPPDARELFANSEPFSTELKKSVKLYSARGQTQFFQVAIRALQDLGQVTVTLSDPSGGNGAKLSDVHVRWAQYREYRQGSSWNTDHRLMMNQIIEQPSDAVTPDRLGVAAVTFTVPDDAPAGQYTASLTVSPEHGKAQTVPINLTVYPFKLERPDHATHAMFYYIVNGDVDPLELIDMQRHGFDGIVAEMSPDGNKDKSGQYPNQQLVMDSYALLTKFGYQSPIICNLGMQGLLNNNTADNRQVYQRTVKATMDYAEKAGFKPIMFPLDEPHTPEQIKHAKLACTWIRDVGGLTYVTSNPDVTRALGPLLTDNGWGLSHLYPNVIARTLSSGQKLMFYAQGDEIGGAGERFHAGFYFARIEPVSSQYFAYFENSEDPMNDLDGGNRDWTNQFPSMNSPFHDPSIAWENFREGINDYKYCYTLRDMAERAKKDGLGGAAQDALKVLDSVMAEVNPDGTKSGGPEMAVETDVRLKNVKVSPNQTSVMGPGWYDESRTKIGNAIAVLQSKMK